MMRRTGLGRLALAVLLLGCGPSEQRATDASAVATASPPSAASSGSAAPAPPAADPPPPAQAKTFAASSNEVGLEIHRRAAKDPGNLALSPASLTTALVMTWGGARGATSDEMRKVLRLGEADRAEAVAI